MSSPSGPAIAIRDVYKSFGPKVIYSGLNLEIVPGETHVIIGRSGEGKSVLLKHISALMGPDRGEVVVQGRVIHPHDRASVQFVRQRVTMVFQMGALFDSLSVRDNVGFYWDQSRKKSRKDTDALVERLLDQVNLPHTGHLFPSELSGGMRKRVGLARALAVNPDIILFDEPTTGLDPVTSQVINELIQKTCDDSNITAIVVTHDMKSAYTVGDRISMLYEGEIIFTGTPREVQDSDNPVIQQFITGSSKGPITQSEDDAAQRLSSELHDRSTVMRRLQVDDERFTDRVTGS